MAAGLVIVACGGGSEQPEATATAVSGGGSESESRQELQPAEPGGIELDTTLETNYYPVEGTTTESIFNHIERNGPTDGDGKRGSGLTSVVWGYEWQGGPETGQCAIRSMTIRAEMEVTLPQHVDPDSLPASIRDDWDAYATSVAVHEQKHVDIYNDGAETIRARMLAVGPKPNCDELEAEIKRVWAEEQAQINNMQAEFHQQEFDRLAQQRAPIATQIDANRVEIDSLQDQIDALDAEILELRSTIDALIFEIAHIDQEIKEVNDSEASPTDKQAQLIVLIQQRNSLQSRHNEAVDEHNDKLAQREPLVTKRSQLIDATNLLVDEFNWTR
jgi:predicted secreted Zn-dependent protease